LIDDLDSDSSYISLRLYNLRVK